MVSKEGGVFAGEGLLDTPMSIFLVQVSVACGWWVGGGGADTKEIRRARAVWVYLRVNSCAKWAGGSFPVSDGC